MTADDLAVEAARVAFVKDLLGEQPGDEPYHFGTTLGELELYRLRRAVRAALAAFHAATDSA